MDPPPKKTTTTHPFTPPPLLIGYYAHDAVDGQGGLGDVGRDHALARPCMCVYGLGVVRLVRQSVCQPVTVSHALARPCMHSCIPSPPVQHAKRTGRGGLEDAGLHLRGLRAVDGEDDELGREGAQLLHPAVEDLGARVDLLLAREEDEHVALRLGEVDLLVGGGGGVSEGGGLMDGVGWVGWWGWGVGSEGWDGVVWKGWGVGLEE